MMMKLIEKLIILIMSIYIVILSIVPYGYKILNKVTVSDSLLAIIIFLYIIYVVSKKENWSQSPRILRDFFTDYFNILLLSLLVIMIISTSYSKEKSLAISESMRFCSYVVLYYIIKYRFNSEKVTNLFLKLFTLVCTILSTFGILQFFTNIGLNKKFISASDIGINKRITSTFENPNSFGGFLILAFFPILMMALKEKNKKHRLLYWLLTALLSINIVFTLSRNAMMAFFLGIAVLCVLYSWRYISIIILSIVISLTVAPIRKRLLQIGDIRQNESRIKLWRTALKMIKEHPILGVGNGNFVSRYDDYVLKYPELRYEDYHRFASHNSFLKVESELGIGGIAIFIFILLTVIRRLYMYTKIFVNSKDRYFYVGFIASVISFYYMNLFDNLLFVPKIATYFWLLFAIAEAKLYRYKNN